MALIATVPPGTTARNAATTTEPTGATGGGDTGTTGAPDATGSTGTTAHTGLTDGDADTEIAERAECARRRLDLVHDHCLGHFEDHLRRSEPRQFQRVAHLVDEPLGA